MSQSPQIPIFVLTIDSPGGVRRAHCERLFAKQELQFTFVDGVSGNDLDIDQVYSRRKNLLFAKRSLSPAEISTYFGHRKIWQEFIGTGEDVCLVVEDDLEIINQTDFQIAISNARDYATWDILNFFDFKPKPILHSEDWHSLSIADYKYPSSGTVAYLINRKAAQKLLSRKKIFRPVDEDLSNCWEFDIRVRSISPNLVDEVSHTLGGSMLEGSRLAEKKQRPLPRSTWAIFLEVAKQFRAYRYRRSLK